MTTITKEEVLDFIWQEEDKLDIENEKIQLEKDIYKDFEIIEIYFNLERFLIVCTKLFIQYYPDFGGIENRRLLYSFAEDFIDMYLKHDLLLKRLKQEEEENLDNNK